MQDMFAAMANLRIDRSNVNRDLRTEKPAQGENKSMMAARQIVTQAMPISQIVTQAMPISQIVTQAMPISMRSLSATRRNLVSWFRLRGSWLLQLLPPQVSGLPAVA